MIISTEFRFRFIQPESADSKICIILFQLFPQICSGTRIGSIHKNIISMKYHLHIHSVIRFYQQPLLFHFFIIFAAHIYLWPHRNHCFNPHLMKFFHHRCRIRKIFFIKPPVSAPRPVIIVNNDHINGNSSFLIFSCYFEYFFLAVITELALPES